MHVPGVAAWLHPGAEMGAAAPASREAVDPTRKSAPRAGCSRRLHLRGAFGAPHP